MKGLSITAIAFLNILAVSAFGQTFVMPTASALALPAHEEFISYAFPFTPGEGEVWLPYQRGKVKTPCLVGFATCPAGNIANFVVVETGKNGVSQIWLTDSHDICGPNFNPAGYCTYAGVFNSAPVATPIQMPDGSFAYSVTSLASGTFVDAFGVTHEGLSAIFNFISYPTPNKNGYGIPASGSVIVEISSL